MSESQFIFLLLIVGCMGMIVGATISFLFSPKLRKEVWDGDEEPVEDEAPYDQEQDARPANETFGPLMAENDVRYRQDRLAFGETVAQKLWQQRQESK